MITGTGAGRRSIVSLCIEIKQGVLEAGSYAAAVAVQGQQRAAGHHRRHNVLFCLPSRDNRSAL